jgi:hypothetical protein
MKLPRFPTEGDVVEASIKGLGRQRQNLCELRAIIEVKQLQRASCPMTTACALHPGRVHTRDNCGFTFHGDGLAAETSGSRETG